MSSSCINELGIDRRRHARVRVPFPVRISGTDTSGYIFDELTLVENMSTHGLYLRLSRAVPRGGPVTLVIHFNLEPSDRGEKHQLGICGEVIHVEELRNGSYGLGIAFLQREAIDS